MDYLDASTETEFIAVATVLQEVQDRARTCGVDIMLVGAAARDILIRHVVGSPPQRATMDVDIAIAVKSWSEVTCLTSSMDMTRGVIHKFLILGVEVDVIPFGGIESPERTITWPNDHEMDVFGFAEALSSAVRVRLPGDVKVFVASLAAQSLLKLLAWRDRHYQDRKDAIDLRSIIDAYSQGPYFEQLYNDHENYLVQYEYDAALAGAARMGQEARDLIAENNREKIRALLNDGDFRARLAADMGGMSEPNLELINAYRAGYG
jgi:predicted nucleotidyltransferase